MIYFRIRMNSDCQLTSITNHPSLLAAIKLANQQINNNQMIPLSIPNISGNEWTYDELNQVYICFLKQVP